MDMAAYLEKKAKGTVLLQRLAKDFFQLVGHRYDTETGKAVAPEVAQINMEGVDASIKEADSTIATIQKRKEGLLALKADMEALEAQAPQ